MSGSLTAKDMDDIGFQRKEWVGERIGWAFMGMVLLAAALGLFSVGPLSRTTASASDASVVVEYDRFARHVGTATMTVTVDPSAVQNKKVTLFISRELSSGWRVQNVTPQPGTESSSRSGLIYEFDVLGKTPPVVEILYRGGGLGMREGTIRAGDDEGVSLWQLTYP